jgi:hypothetical protein
VKPNASACKLACETHAACNYGTYISGGQRQGECWLSATTSKTQSNPCGVPCESFLIVNSTKSANKKRRLLAGNTMGFVQDQTNTVFMNAAACAFLFVLVGLAWYQQAATHGRAIMI